MGALGGTMPRSDARTIVRCLDWLLQHDEPIEEALWKEAYAIATSCKDPRARLKAIALIGDRIDPVPKPLIQAVVQGDLHVAWQLPSSPSPTALAPSKPSSTTPSPTNGHGPASPSATDDLESL